MATSKASAPSSASKAQAPEGLLCFALYSSGLAMTKVYRKLLAPLGLTYSQYLAMLVLWDQDEQSVSEIGERLFLDSATLTPLLKRLEKMGLITRRRSRDDERHVVVTLTGVGRDMRQKAASIQKAIFQATQCSHEELKALTDRLQRLRRDLLARS